jgi:hypothetical protein
MAAKKDKQLVLGGTALRCIERLPMGMIFDLAEAMESGIEMQAIAAMSRMLKTVVIKEDLVRLDEVLHRVDDAIGFDALNTAIGDLMVQYSGRPLERPSRSARGRKATGGTSRVVSLSKGTVRTSARSSTDGSSVAS